MGKVFEQKIKRFDGGIKNDPRDPRENTCRVVTNFNILTNPYKMTPYRESESGDTSSSTQQIQNFLIANNGTSEKLYGLGVQADPNQTRARLFEKALTTGGSQDLSDQTWTASVNGQTGQATTSFNLFVYYRRTGLIYGAHTGTHIWAFDPAGGAIADTSQALTYTTVFQGLVHSKDDILYIPYYSSTGSFIARNNNGSWNNTALTLPRDYIPVSICEYGNFLAIGCSPRSGVGNSVIFLWDRDSSLATLSESIDAGSGVLVILEEVGGDLIWISQQGGTDTSGLNIPGSISFQDKVVFRRYLGGNQSEIIQELRGGANTTLLPISKQVVDNRLYFMMYISLAGAVREGTWSIGRNQEGRYALVHERTPNNDTALTSSLDLHGAFIVGDYLFQSYTTGGTVSMSKTNDQNEYDLTAIWESKIFDGGDSSLKKKLLGVTLHTEFLPTGASCVAAYKMDNETSFTTILTHNTAAAISDSAVNIESSGAALPEFKEIQFRIESTDGAEITGLSFTYEVTGKRNYE